MKIFKIALSCAAICATTAISTAHAQEPIKIGIVASMSGPFASYGKQVENGINAFLKEKGDVVAGRKVNVIYRDDGGPNPEVAKRLTQELVSRDNVDVLGGYIFTPNSIAAAPIATGAKKPMFVMVSGTASVTTKSPYILRTSYTLAQMAQPMGEWAAKNGIKNAYIMVSDYGPGYEGAEWFTKGFQANGGQISGEVKVPLSARDFAPYVQRIKDAKPEAVFVFLPGGETTIAFMKEYANRGLAKAGIKIISVDGLADDETQEAIGEPLVGVTSTGFYTTAHQSQMNTRFISNYNSVSGGKLAANFVAVAAYDAMQVIYASIEQQKGQLDSEKLLASAKGMKFESPRGMIEIDAQTRDLIQDIYVRRVERVNGKLVNREFDKFSVVKDPTK